LQLSWLHSYILHRLDASFKRTRNIQAAAKVNVFWLNLKEWWPFFCRKLNKQFEDYSGKPEVATAGRNLLSIQLLQQSHPGTSSNICKELQYQTDALPHSLKASVVSRNTESSWTNSDFSLNPNFHQHINGTIGIFPLTQLNSKTTNIQPSHPKWAGNSDPEVKDGSMHALKC